MVSSFTTTIILSVVILLSARQSSAHSFLTDPAPWNRVFQTESCEGSECSQACPNILRRGMRNTPDSPEKVWQRGQQVSIKWAKNNHRGGLVRMSIVPVDHTMSRDWHSKLAIYHGCWEQGQYRCSGELCGSDSDNEGFQRTIEIPAVIPDGTYVFGLVWYGGLHFSRDKGQFPDYFSCAYVKISGGPLESTYQPFFEDGDTGRFRHSDGTCDTASDQVGECPVSGCTGPAFAAVSKPYQNGATPPMLTARDFGGSAEDVASAGEPGPKPVSVPEDPISEPESTPAAVPEPVSVPEDPISEPESTPAAVPEPTPVPEEEPESTPAAVPEPTPVPEEEPEPVQANSSTDMVCTGPVCCPATCGKCGGAKCNKRPGGGSNCCYSKIRKTGRVCGQDPPPCVRD